MPTTRKCPHCDFETEDESINFCPKHGARLEASVVWYDAFISYRHKTGLFQAQAVRSSLEAQYRMNVFVDRNVLRAGKFDDTLIAKIEAAPNLILILTDGSLERCQAEDDWLRREIAHALKHGLNIIPVLFGGYEMPAPEKLPADIRDLARWQAIRFDDSFPDASYRRIGEWCKLERRAAPAARASLGTTLGGPAGSDFPKPAGPDLGRAASEKRPAVEVAPLVIRSAGAPTVPTPGQNWTVPGVGIEMIWIEPGSFVMGSPEGETDRSNDETQHRVTLTRGFWLGKYPVTQRQWQELMGHNPSHFVTGKVLAEGGWFTERRVMPDSSNFPVEQVSWEECVAFCGQLTAAERTARRSPDGYSYMLPTETQWEYACRAGSTGPYAGTGELSSMGWYFGNSGSRTHPVGQKKPNAWGLYDMHGNVCEWCRDWYTGWVSGDSVVDPTGPSPGTHRVYRGGSWGHTARCCRSANRDGNEAGNRFDLGFRLALSSVP